MREEERIPGTGTVWAHFHRVFESKQSSVSVDCPERAAVLRCASEVVREGRREQRRQEARTELVRQLQEAEATEAKENLKVCGASWYECSEYFVLYYTTTYTTIKVWL